MNISNKSFWIIGLVIIASFIIAQVPEPKLTGNFPFSYQNKFTGSEFKTCSTEKDVCVEGGKCKSSRFNICNQNHFFSFYNFLDKFCEG